MTEEAKAAKEFAKTVSKTVDAGRELGRYAGRFFSGPLEQVSGMLTDKLAYVRWERLHRLGERADAFLAEKGLEAPTRRLSLNVGVPLFEAASLEEDDDLQDNWARLLANAADGDSGVEVRRRFVSILQDFGPLESKLLSMLVRQPEVDRSRVVFTGELPNRVISCEDWRRRSGAGAPPKDVELALWNLARLGCVAPSETAGGASVHFLRVTELGIAMVEACTVSTTTQSG